MAFYSLLSHLQTLSLLPSAAIQEHPTQLQHPPRDRLHLRITLIFRKVYDDQNVTSSNGHSFDKLKLDSVRGKLALTACFKTSIIFIVAYLLKATPIRKAESLSLIVFSLSLSHTNTAISHTQALLSRSTSLTFSLPVRAVLIHTDLWLFKFQGEKWNKMLTC